jgi:hypothetical protein
MLVLDQLSRRIEELQQTKDAFSNARHDPCSKSHFWFIKDIPFF